LDARKSSQEGIDMSTFYCTKESLVKFSYFYQKNNSIAIIGYRSFALSVLVWGWGKKKPPNHGFGK
jgi:hypothetical protein